MSTIGEIIRAGSDSTLSFGDYAADEKRKANDFELDGDMYNVKTHNQVTRLEKNGKLLFESVPGTNVHDFKVSGKQVAFLAEGLGDTQITLELESEKEYKIIIGEVNVGSMRSNLSGKISFSAELGAAACAVRIEKLG